MDKQEAKLILSSYTLDNEPANDERFNAAKNIAEADEEVGTWWESQKEVDRMMSSSIRSFEVPADLHSALGMTIDDRQRKRLRFARARNWFSVAALFVFGFFAYFQWGIDRSDDYTGPLAERALEYSMDGPRLAYFNEDTSKLKSWLVENGFDLPDQLPPKLLEQEGIGCRPLNWSNEKVALMCFDSDTVYHLYVAKQSDFPDFEATEQFAFLENENGWTTSQWKSGEHVFLFTAKATADELSKYLAGYSPTLATNQI